MKFVTLLDSPAGISRQYLHVFNVLVQTGHTHAHVQALEDRVHGRGRKNTLRLTIMAATDAAEVTIELSIVTHASLHPRFESKSIAPTHP